MTTIVRTWDRYPSSEEYAAGRLLGVNDRTLWSIAPCLPTSIEPCDRLLYAVVYGEDPTDHAFASWDRDDLNFDTLTRHGLHDRISLVTVALKPPEAVEVPGLWATYEAPAHVWLRWIKDVRMFSKDPAVFLGRGYFRPEQQG